MPGTHKQEVALTLNISQPDKLFASYMPFIKNGGLFIATNKKFQLGDEVTVSCQTSNEIDPHKITAKIIWITPAAALGNRPAGIGIQLGPEQTPFRHKIESILAGITHYEKRTDTL